MSQEKSRGSPAMFLTSMMKEEICRRRGIKQKKQKHTGSKQKGSKGSEESKGGLLIGTQCEESETCLNKNSRKKSISTDLRETG